MVKKLKELDDKKTDTEILEEINQKMISNRQERQEALKQLRQDFQILNSGDKNEIK